MSILDDMLETALWSTIGFDENGKDFMLDSKYSISDFPEDIKLKCQSVIDAFMEKATPLFTDDELEDSPIGHDLWLTIHGHGAGFWDGNYQNGDALTDICEGLDYLEDELRDSLDS